MLGALLRCMGVSPHAMLSVSFSGGQLRLFSRKESLPALSGGKIECSGHSVSAWSSSLPFLSRVLYGKPSIKRDENKPREESIYHASGQNPGPESSETIMWSHILSQSEAMAESLIAHSDLESGLGCQSHEHAWAALVRVLLPWVHDSSFNSAHQRVCCVVVTSHAASLKSF